MPQLEVWEKVQVGPGFLQDRHGSASCVSCHGGQDGELTKSQAHVGMVTDPSAGEAPACRSCHESHVTSHRASLHGTQNGYWTMFARRWQTDTEPINEFGPMFEKQCSSCHTSCGQCHISRPGSVEGGLVAAHSFQSRPSQTDNCIACHGSRVGDEFRGHNTGIPPDVHYLMGMTCFACHSGAELHGNGATPALRYEAVGAPQCADCHPGVLEDDGNAQHSIHAETVACQVCHAVAYKNCYNCHVGTETKGLVHPSRMDFRIGKNPLQGIERPWNYQVVRHIPIAPTSYEDWGIELSGYASEPTWRYATPHNIQKSTPQNASCDACHGIANRFLTPDYLDALIREGVMFQVEIDANQGVVVTELPSMNEGLAEGKRR